MTVWKMIPGPGTTYRTNLMLWANTENMNAQTQNMVDDSTAWSTL